MKKILLFLLFFGIGILGVMGYKLVKKSPGKPIENILQTVTKPVFSVKDAPSEAVKGTILQMTGEVRWESREATEAAQITSPVIVQQGERIQTGENGNLSIEFPKASLISISPKTQIDFIQTLPINFVVDIASGSASFKKLTDYPVSMRALHLLVDQKSGEVSVGVDEENGVVNVNIISGAIMVAFNDVNLVSQVVGFEAPQRISFNDSSRSFE